MGTSALVILWYGLLALILMLLSREHSSLAYGLAGGVIFLFLLYSFFSHHKHRKHKLFLMIVFPLLLLGISSFVLEDSGIYPPMPVSAPLQWIPPSQVELNDFQLEHRFFMDRIIGKIRNNSSSTIENILLRIKLVGSNDEVEVYDLPIHDLNLKPGGVQPFSQTLLGWHSRRGGDLKWSVQTLSVAGE